MYFLIGPDGQESGPYDLDTLRSWRQSGQLPDSAQLRHAVTGQPIIVIDEPMLAQASDGRRPGSASAKKIVPTGNPASLAAYYLGLGSCLPVLGLPLSVVAIFYAWKGWQNYKTDPQVYGKFHFIAGFVMGLVSLVYNGWMVGALAMALASRPS